ncbi:MAG: GTP-binding protein [Euryarchaeota archaeon]|nr:GTP-binding protein [Euryarchaeota archaeon]
MASYKKKVVVLGDGAVGKTSLVRRFVIDEFSDEYITTIGAKATKKDITVEVDGQGSDVSIILWDVLGQKGYSEVQAGALQQAKGVVVVYDVSRPETHDSLEHYWIPRVWRLVGRIPAVIFANKVDLLAEPALEAASLEVMCRRYGCNGYVTSAKTGENVEAAFRALGEAMVLAGEARPAQTSVVLLPREPEDYGLVAVADWIIADFCQEFGDLEDAMPIVRDRFARAGVDVRRPTRETLTRAVEYLAEVERGFQPEERIAENRDRRLVWVNGRTGDGVPGLETDVATSPTERKPDSD